jgi:hypothetical protein
MFPSRTRRTRGAVLTTLAAAAAVPALAGSAHAQIATGPFTPTSTSQITIETVGFGITGTPDGISTVRLNPATATFTWDQGVVAAHVAGTVHVEGGQNASFRVRVDSQAADNTVLGTVYDDVKGTPVKHATQDIPVDVTATPAPNLKKIRVVIEEKASGPRWKNRGEITEAGVPRQDDVTVLGTGLGKGFDIGGLGFHDTAPDDPASVVWSLGDDGALTATYYGYLHFRNAAGRSARVVLRAIEPLAGREVDEDKGKAHTPSGNAHEVFPGGSAPESLSVTSSTATKVDVVIQSLIADPKSGDADWQDVASERVSATE